MDSVTLTLVLSATVGTLFGWFVHRRYDDLRNVRAEVAVLMERLRGIELTLAKIQGILGDGKP